LRIKSSSATATVVGFVALWAFVAAAYINTTYLERIPHVSDEVSYLFQGRIIASGNLVLQPPLLGELFQQDNVILDDVRWCSKYPPGWPALLAVGFLAGAPWLVNPLLLALTVIGVWRLGRVLFDESTGVLAAIALACSPFAVLMGSGFMSHVAAMCAAVWCMVALAGCERRRSALQPFLAGLLGGVAFLIRPFSATVLLLPAVLWVLWVLWRRRSKFGSVKVAGWIAVGFLPCLAMFLLYRWQVFGHPLQSGYSIYDPTETFRGIGGAYLSISDLLARNVPWYFTRLNHGLWGWPWPDLLPFGVLLWRRKGWAREGMLGCCALALVTLHLGWYYRDMVYSGPRFALEALGPLSVLLARAMLRLVELQRLAVGRFAPALPAAVRYVPAVVLCAALFIFPMLRLVEQASALGDWYHGQSVKPLRTVKTERPGDDALVFVAALEFAYATWFDRNRLSHQSPGRIYVRDIPELRARALREYPREEVWQLFIDLEPLENEDLLDRNTYPDRWRARKIRWSRARR